MVMMTCWMWIFGDVEGYRWVLDRSRMAFAEAQASRVTGMATGDKAILYTSRGAFGNPMRDTSRLVGIVELSGAVKRGKPVKLADRTFNLFARFEKIRILPERKGPGIAALIGRLECVKNARCWGQSFRRSPIKLTTKDFRILEEAVQDWAEY